MNKKWFSLLVICIFLVSFVVAGPGDLGDVGAGDTSIGGGATDTSSGTGDTASGSGDVAGDGASGDGGTDPSGDSSSGTGDAGNAGDAANTGIGGNVPSLNIDPSQLNPTITLPSSVSNIFGYMGFSVNNLGELFLNSAMIIFFILLFFYIIEIIPFPTKLLNNAFVSLALSAIIVIAFGGYLGLFSFLSGLLDSIGVKLGIGMRWGWIVGFVIMLVLIILEVVVLSKVSKWLSKITDDSVDTSGADSKANDIAFGGDVLEEVGSHWRK
ncbi:MAG: hypothetical protein KKF56_02575 [Nanoarchaeota archaeon]|nr:hypothetical protein [Nanoarchaeota archaeon]